MNNSKLCCPPWLNKEFRKLWIQHIYRTRFFIISTASDLPDLPYVTKWVLENPGDFACLLKEFYGEERANIFKKLFTEHLTIAADLVNAIKNNDRQKTESTRKKWYENANEIACFLGKINPCWSKDRWKKLMFDHLKMTENHAKLRISGKYPEDIAEFNCIEKEAMEMADYMTKGIIKQCRGCFSQS